MKLPTPKCDRKVVLQAVDMVHISSIHFAVIISLC